MTTLELIAALAGTLFQPAESPQSNATITVHRRFASLVCVGVCTDSDLLVRPDGVVEYRVKKASDGHWKNFHYRVSPRQVREFWDAYASLRPKGLKGPVGTCNPNTLIIDYDIWWNDKSGRGRLLACGDVDEVRRAYWTGFRILRFSPVTGKKLTAKQAEALR